MTVEIEKTGDYTIYGSYKQAVLIDGDEIGWIAKSGYQWVASDGEGQVTRHKTRASAIARIESEYGYHTTACTCHAY